MKKTTLLLALMLSAMLTVPAQCTHTFDPGYDHAISLNDGALMTATYRAAMPAGAEIANAFGRTALLSILNQSDNKGIRFYFGKEADGRMNLIAVGVDPCGDDQAGGIVLDRSICCLPGCACSHANALNSD